MPSLLLFEFFSPQIDFFQLFSLRTASASNMTPLQHLFNTSNTNKCMHGHYALLPILVDFTLSEMAKEFRQGIIPPFLFHYSSVRGKG